MMPSYIIKTHLLLQPFSITLRDRVLLEQTQEFPFGLTHRRIAKWLSISIEMCEVQVLSLPHSS
jgi:hypothetical protein